MINNILLSVAYDCQSYASMQRNGGAGFACICLRTSNTNRHVTCVVNLRHSSRVCSLFPATIGNAQYPSRQAVFMMNPVEIDLEEVETTCLNVKTAKKIEDFYSHRRFNPNSSVDFPAGPSSGERDPAIVAKDLESHMVRTITLIRTLTSDTNTPCSVLPTQTQICLP